MTATRTVLAALSAVLVAALMSVGPRTALSAPPLPDMPADELVASALRAAQNPPPVSGELSATLGLGLPDLPGDTGDGGPTDLLGVNRLRMERSADGVRVALLGEHSERLVVSDGQTLTTWDSRTLEVTRWTTPQGAVEHPNVAERPDVRDPARSNSGWPGAGWPDPMALAIPLLAALEETGEVTVDGTARVAGRDAYRLTVIPDDPVTTVGRFEMDVDGATSVPLRVALFAGDATAASAELAWTQLTFDPVDPATFDFSPPPGASVTERSLQTSAHALDHPAPGPTGPHSRSAPGRVVGTGYSAVAVLPLPPEALVGVSRLLPLDGPLLSARLAEVDGEQVVLSGFVPLSRLDEVAAELR